MKLTVIFPPHIDFDRMQQRPQRLMEAFARNGHNVIYMNMGQIPGAPNEIVEDRLHVVRDQSRVFDMVEGLRSSSRIVLWSMWTENWKWHEILNPDVTVYDYIDDFKEWEAKLPQMVSRADLLFSTANVLKTKMSGWYPSREVTLLENACEYEHFSKVSEDPFLDPPADFPEVHKPVVGYIGALAKWVDWNLVSLISHYHPVVMVGPVMGVSPPKNGNIHYMGEKHYKTLPSYIKRMNVLVIPFLINEITLATNPIKMWEYLASGRPVVTTGLPEAFKAKNEVRIATSHPQFLDAIHRGLQDSNDDFAKKKRMEFAKERSWQARYETAYEKICGFLSKKYPGSSV